MWLVISSRLHLHTTAINANYGQLPKEAVNCTIDDPNVPLIDLLSKLPKSIITKHNIRLSELPLIDEILPGTREESFRGLTFALASSTFNKRFKNGGLNVQTKSTANC